MACESGSGGGSCGSPDVDELREGVVLDRAGGVREEAGHFCGVSRLEVYVSVGQICVEVGEGVEGRRREEKVPKENS